MIFSKEELQNKELQTQTLKEIYFLIHMPTCLVKVELARKKEAKKVKATKTKQNYFLFWSNDKLSLPIEASSELNQSQKPFSIKKYFQSLFALKCSTGEQYFQLHSDLNRGPMNITLFGF